MAQQRELPPLNPSTGDVLGTMLKPWLGLLYVGVKVLPAAVPALVLIFIGDGIFSTANDAATTAAFEQSVNEMSASHMMVLDLLPMLLVVVILAVTIQLMVAMHSR